MTKITKKEAINFLNKIKKSDKVAIIHHDDGDGYCSGIILNDHCKLKGAKTKNFQYSLGTTSLQELPLKKFNKIIITDISTKETKDQFEGLLEKEILYIDHHPKFPLPKEIKAYLTADSGYIPASRTAYELTKIKRWLGLIGTISDSGEIYKENNKFIKESLEEIGLTLTKFKNDYAYILCDTIIYFENKKRDTFKKLSKIKSLEEIDKLKKYADEVEKEIVKELIFFKKEKETSGNTNFYELNPKFNIKSIIISILSKENPEKIFIFFSKKKANKKYLKISARHQGKNANLPKLLSIGMKGLEKTNCGGHKRSSGGQILTKDKEKFKRNIKDYLSKHKS
jgi:single-stranded DNA-specific DHH superfamily exonuclease